MEKELRIDTLNGLPFPGEFVSEEGREEIIITGKKTFAGHLSIHISLLSIPYEFGVFTQCIKNGVSIEPRFDGGLSL